jgi:hypothetical protein
MVGRPSKFEENEANTDGGEDRARPPHRVRLSAARLDSDQS